jgi:DNA-binding NarL/FixJ family response regulator
MEAEGAWDLPSLLAAIDTDGSNIVVIRSGMREGATLLKMSLRLGRSTRVVLFDLSVDRESEIVSAAEAGVAGLLLHSESFETLLTTLRTVSQGHARCSSDVSAILLRRVYAFAGDINPHATTEKLTARELEILELVAQGLSNQQIASRLTLSLPTVKNHLHRLLSKMGVASRAEAAIVYRGEGYGAT